MTAPKNHNLLPRRRWSEEDMLKLLGFYEARDKVTLMQMADIFARTHSAVQVKMSKMKVDMNLDRTLRHRAQKVPRLLRGKGRKYGGGR